ncbi:MULTISPECIES: winged helix-turn-helix transcriptional regulator [Streptomycetaceae]|uniref:Transcriptional regulator n=1 Tax=Streptantibioticus cattleyicolor (strain ATCC 35852 / DSM 46488 / JCM 4925 / NBRC 14057 / NRRL 8057) TaxID=1003195 RepID=F8K3V1_STREN|nr:MULTISPECIES: helix-turn-helix domain-containing protein [Streptomycetaceae]AEW97646.1 transcriptional regulator [Streptantibioticus cattleyicolor NRRL 8057 = DSM 46488]MYS62074.1 transcriptional regulator [Streptomyces sp. SID5468]CCB77967.1 putative transcriptional regulator [Streptantibioticus cattleyicolor NRRL 8057 = DSM 46488]
MADRPDHVTFQHGQAFLAAISERWNYQILREVFFGVHRFGELKRTLGISATMLTARLNDLTELGLLEKRAYRADKPWFEYRLTDPARELVVPAVVAVTRWAETHADARPTDARPLLHTSCGHRTEPYLACSSCHRPIEADTLEPLTPQDDGPS